MVSNDRLNQAREVEKRATTRRVVAITPISLTYLAEDIGEIRLSARLIVPKDEDDRTVVASQVREGLGAKYQTLRQNLTAAQVTERQAIRYLSRTIPRRRGESSPRQIANFFARDVFRLPR